MEKITNTSHSADSTLIGISTTPSNDDDDTEDHQKHFIIPSSDFDVPRTTIDNGVVPSHMIININNHETDSLTNDDQSSIIQPSTSITTLDTAQFNTYSDSSLLNVETNSNQPFIDQHQIVPVYASPINNDDEQIISSAASSTSSNESTIVSRSSYMTLYFTDMLISAFIITPFVNIHWRGAWDLLDIHLLPDYPVKSALISGGVGYAMLYMFYLTQGYLQSFYENNRHNIMGLIMTRLYTLLLALAYINQWRGLWSLLDLTSNEWYHLLGEAGISIILLLVMRSIYNLNSAPFIIGIDTDSYFLLDSKYTVTNNHFFQYTFDFFYYEMVEGPLLTLAWRGLYNLSDLYIYPDSRQLSMVISLGSGYLLYFILSFIQIPIVRCLIRQRRDLLHSIISNLFHLIAFLSVVQIWRSLWIICEQYLNIPEYHNTTLWLCYGISFVVLTCGLAACSLNGPGGSKDSYVDEGPSLIFSFDYFSSLLRLQRVDEVQPNPTSSHSGIILWLITHLLRRREQRRNSMRDESRRNTIISVAAPPTSSEKGRWGYRTVNKDSHMSSEDSSAATIIPAKRPCRLEPP